MRDKKAASLLAIQIVFDYPDWGDEHIGEMLDLYKQNKEKPPCDYDELQSLCNKADKLREEGKTADEIEAALLAK